MYIRLLKEWRRYRIGSVLELPDDEGFELILAHKAMRAHKGDYMKNISFPPHDKMMTKADRNK